MFRHAGLQVHRGAAIVQGAEVGRNMMDMFMDKLAQKFNAQEIIKANTAAETEELNKLRSRVAEYNECLDKLAALIASGSAKLEGAQADNADLKAKAEGIQNSVDALKEVVEWKSGDIEANTRDVGTLLKDIEAITQDVETLLKESMEKITAMQQGVEAIVASSGDNVHKECVKVYRNVQAVVVEEGTKQTENLELITAKVNSVKGKASAALGISIVTFILVLSSVAMQVLELLNIKLF